MHNLRRIKTLVTILHHSDVTATLAAVASIKAQTRTGVDIAVVDNRDHWARDEGLDRYFSDCLILQPKLNDGYTGGCNYAIGYALSAKYDYLFVATSDITLPRDCLDLMLETMEDDENVGILGAVEVDAVTGRERTVGGVGYNFWLSRAKWKQTKVLEETITNGWVRVDYVQGAFWGMPRNAMLRGIRFDNDIFMYGDESMLGASLKALGLAAMSNVNVRILHNNASKWFRPISGYYIQRNRFHMVKKHGRWYHIAFYSLYVVLLELPIKFTLRSLQGHSPFAVACVLGLKDGLSGRMGRGRVFED